MTAVGELVLVLGLLVSAHCEVRARDPEDAEDAEEQGGRGGGGGEVYPAFIDRLLPGVTETPPLGDGGNYPARTGNWCAFVQRHLVSRAVVCGTEKYTIESRSPCPSRTPDCHLIMYKLSSRPLYRQKQQIVSALLWRCCPGHGGPDCEDTEPDAQQDPGSSALIGGSEPVRTELHAPGVQARLQQQRSDPNREQNDYQDPLVHHNHQDHRENQNHQDHQKKEEYQHHQDNRENEKDKDLQDLQNLYDKQYQQTNSTTPPPLDQDQDYQKQDEHQNHQEDSDNQKVQNLQDLYEQQEQQTDSTTPPPLDPDQNHTSPPASDPNYLHHHRETEHFRPDELDAPSTPSTPQMVALILSQLQPLLQGFNRSLELLTRQVGDLARDVAQLKSFPLRDEMLAEPLYNPELDEAAEQRLEAKLEDHIREVQRQLEDQRSHMEHRLHSQHAMLHYNLTKFKTDIDVKLKRNQKMLQVSLQAMNATLTELKLDQDLDQDLYQDLDQDQDLPPPPSMSTRRPLMQSSDMAALWKVVERLDNMVVNNTVKVVGLLEDVEAASGGIQQLWRKNKDLETLINQTARDGQVKFMMTGLEVEAARETVLQRVGEMEGNLSLQGARLQENNVDVDYLFEVHNSQNATTGCDCTGLQDAVRHLERGVANVTELANENRVALEEEGDMEAGQWWGDWGPAVEALQRGLQQVKESMSSEQIHSRALEVNVTRIRSSLTQTQAEVSALQEEDERLVEEQQRLSASFKSLLTDAIRHSDVLELLLGEEVMEFLEWPVQDQEAHSIPSLKEQLRVLQEQLGGRRKPGMVSDQPSSSSSSSHPLPEMRSSSSGSGARERQQLLQPPGGDGGDLWKLEQRVEELGLKLLSLQKEREVPPAGVEAKLQAEVQWLRRGLEEHLKVFKNVFSNADVLMSSDASLQLDQLWHLLKEKQGRKERKRGGHERSRREDSGSVPSPVVAPDPSSLSGASLLIVAGSPRSVSGVLVFETSLNRDQVYSDSGVFTAPQSGVYLFSLTLDLRPGPTQVMLRRGGARGVPMSLRRRGGGTEGPVTSAMVLSLRRGEEVRLEIKEGSLRESRDTVFNVLLLLHQTT
ncbi:multimerin-2a isoform X2 [Pseudochaenichthys georgianus]|uniref:multimerin-2a isoform X2 n=1 Tax=Pseudochaenichthys georgianus TaxID=52239 RepID=UPI00146B7D5F|nr:multimerin-2a isoform X2 [Pseudochaenichthys georgianus]